MIPWLLVRFQKVKVQIPYQIIADQPGRGGAVSPEAGRSLRENFFNAPEFYFYNQTEITS